MTSRGQPNKRVIWREVQISRVLATIALYIRLVDQLRSMIPMKETLDLVSDYQFEPEHAEVDTDEEIPPLNSPDRHVERVGNNDW